MTCLFVFDFVMLAKAGIQIENESNKLDSRLHGNDRNLL